MQLLKKEISGSVVKGSLHTLVALERDANVSDARPDMAKIIMSEAMMQFDHAEALQDRVKVTGTLHYRVLYMTEEEPITFDSLEGELLLEEVLNMEGVQPGQQLSGSLRKEDFKVRMIHSRKLEIKALIAVNLVSEATEKKECAYSIENGEGIACQYADSSYTRKVADGKDVFRIHQEMNIPQNKPNIQKLAWYRLALANLDTRALDDKVQLRGELVCFLLYYGDEEHMPVQYLTQLIPIDGTVELPGCKADMVTEIAAALGEHAIEVKEDGDGERRILEINATVDLRLKAYAEDTLQILADVYAPGVELVQTYENVHMEQLVLQNNAKAKISDRISLPKEESMLQICDTAGEVSIDDTQVSENGVTVEGILQADILYVSSEDTHPILCYTVQLPYTYEIEADDIRPNDHIAVEPCLESISAIMIDSEQVELRAVIELKLVVFRSQEVKGICDLRIEPIDYEKRQQIPAMCGYIIQEGDTLWSVAKQFYASLDTIRELNDLKEDTLIPGELLFIVAAPL